MNKIVLNDTTAAILSELKEGAQLCDATGKVVGFFTPAADPSLYMGTQAPISREEIQRRENNLQGRPLDEILGDLENRA